MSTKDEELFSETRKFSELLQKNPDNLRNWLDFLRYQQKIAGFCRSAAKNSQGLLEKQLKIVEKALERGSLQGNPLLLLLKLKLFANSQKGEDLYKGLESLWEACLLKKPEDLLFWSLFFEYKFTNFIKFSVFCSFLKENL